MKKRLSMGLALACFALTTMAQEDKTFTAPNIHGTLRGKYEYQTQEDKGRFEVRQPA